MLCISYCFKGSGRTPYSRFGDGRAVLRSSGKFQEQTRNMYLLIPGREEGGIERLIMDFFIQYFQ